MNKVHPFPSPPLFPSPVYVCDSYTWGSNGSGRLGLGHRGGCGTPTCVESLQSIAIRQVAMGRNHSAAIAAVSDGLYMWGCAAGGE